MKTEKTHPSIDESSEPRGLVALLAVILCLAFMGLLAAIFLTSGYAQAFSLPFTSSSTPTLIGLEIFFENPATATPFQPVLPTATKTFTPTATLTLTPTATKRPSSTPYPTFTPIPTRRPAATNAPVADDSDSVVLSITGSGQTHNLSCESRAAVNWAGYYGVSLTEDTFLAHLPSSDDPDTGFVGDPDDYAGSIPPNSYGVHADPVANLLNAYGVNARAVHGYSFSSLRSQIDAGDPVIVWVYGHVWAGGSPVTYTASNGNTTWVIPYEHTVIVYGYDDSNVWIMDGGSKYTRDISVFKDSWSTLGYMAIIMD